MRRRLILLIVIFSLTPVIQVQATGDDIVQFNRWIAEALRDLNLSQADFNRQPGLRTEIHDNLRTLKNRGGTVSIKEVFDEVEAIKDQINPTRYVRSDARAARGRGRRPGRGHFRGGYGSTALGVAGIAIALLPAVVQGAQGNANRIDWTNTGVEVAIAGAQMIPVVGTLVTTYVMADFAINASVNAIIGGLEEQTRADSNVQPLFQAWGSLIARDLLSDSAGTFPWNRTQPYTAQAPLYLDQAGLANCFNLVAVNATSRFTRIRGGGFGPLEWATTPRRTQERIQAGVYNSSSSYPWNPIGEWARTLIPVGYTALNLRTLQADRDRLFAAVVTAARNDLDVCVQGVYLIGRDRAGNARPLGAGERAVVIGTDPGNGGARPVLSRGPDGRPHAPQTVSLPQVVQPHF